MTRRDANLRPIRDGKTGEYIAHHDRETGEVVRIKQGRILRGKLTERGEERGRNERDRA